MPPDRDALAAAVTERLRDPSGSIGVGAAVPDDHGALCRRAVEHVHATEMGHLARIESALAGRAGVHVLGGERGGAACPGRVATLSFTVDGLDTARVADALDADHGICARAGLQCAPLVHVDAGTADSGGTVRLSPGYFTDEEDMTQLLEALDEVLACAPRVAPRSGEAVLDGADG